MSHRRIGQLILCRPDIPHILGEPVSNLHLTALPSCESRVPLEENCVTGLAKAENRWYIMDMTHPYESIYGDLYHAFGS